MACNEWREEWVAHLYGELSAEQQQTVDRHLEECDACRETMRGLGESRRLLESVAPPVPSVPRLVVLKPRAAWSTAWAFASGVAAAALVFFIGTLAAPRGEPTGSPTDTRAGFEASVDGLDDRVTMLEQARPPIHAEYAADEVLTREQLDRELDRLSRRFRRERAEDLDYLVRWLAASEQRTGTFIDRTEEALTYLALRGDPRVRER